MGRKKQRSLLLFLKFCIILIEFSVYIARKCPGHPFLNCLYPPLLMYTITGAGKSTRPLNSQSCFLCHALKREKLSKFNSGVGNW